MLSGFKSLEANLSVKLTSLLSLLYVAVLLTNVACSGDQKPGQSQTQSQSLSLRSESSVSEQKKQDAVVVRGERQNSEDLDVAEGAKQKIKPSVVAAKAKGSVSKCQQNGEVKSVTEELESAEVSPDSEIVSEKQIACKN
jgi:hypothetical protein